jgi:sec-independent protein translocase protein TatB
MFDFSWTEIALIGGVALVVIGPKDLPRALRTAGIWVRKARSISREFQGTIEQMMREAELDEVKKTIEKATSFNVEDEIKRHIDPSGELGEALKPPEMPDFETLAGKTDETPAPPPQSAGVPDEVAALPPPDSVAFEPPPSAEEAPDPLPESDPAPLVHLAAPLEAPVSPGPEDRR